MSFLLLVGAPIAGGGPTPPPSWLPSSLPNWAAGGDWWTRGINVYKNDSLAAASAVDDPVYAWDGRVNALRILEGTAGNQPKVGASGVRFLRDGVNRRLRTATLPSMEGARTVWAKVSVAAAANHYLLIGQGDDSASNTGIGGNPQLYGMSRGSGTFGNGNLSGTHTIIMVTNGTSSVVLHKDGDAPASGSPGSQIGIARIGISSGSFGSSDFTVIDWGCYFGAVTSDELDLLKTYLAGVSA